MAEQPRLIAGAMSGTSGDGVDIAIVRIDGRGLGMLVTLLMHHHVPFDASIRSRLFAIRESQQLKLSELAKLGREISLTYARGVNEALSAANLQANQLSAVAAHGQTLFHDPPDTIQWLDPALLAAEVGCPVVSDFRRADCAAGGQGAPLVPFADYILFRDANKSRVLLNLGGIANMTWLAAGASPDQVIGFDTGPANCVLDYLMRESGEVCGYDRDGQLSAHGNSHFGIASGAIRIWRDLFRRPPKSADIPEMIAAFQQACKAFGSIEVSLPDRLATACTMAALGIALNLPFLPGKPEEIIASGGGVKNPRLLQEIKTITKLPVRCSDDLGILSDAKEAIAFALLAAATLDGVPSNIPSATGARRAVILGSITPKPSPG